MQKLSIVAILLALCLAQTYGDGNFGRALLQGGALSRGSSGSRSSGGSSSASVSVRSTGGSSRGRAVADSRVFTQTKSVLITFCERVFNQVKFLDYKGGNRGRYCVSAYSLIKDLVVAYGKASASAFASTSATVDIQGSGSGCASAYSDANAVAEAYAEIVGQAVAEARIGKFSARSDLVANIVSSALVQAFAQSHAEACSSQEGYASAYQKTHARAIGYPIATLWIWLFAEVDCRTESEFAETVAEGESTVQTETSVTTSDNVDASDGAFADAGGDGLAVVTQHCRNFGVLSQCCSRRNLRRRVCYCGSRRNGLCNAKLERDVRRVWVDDVSGKACHC